ncbi:pIN domain protein [Phascolarctobacterium sp. CAG:266]|nr:pIN domain protein [Phascolarctobacterium sp. CAG:266]
MIVPKFVIRELQTLADSSDGLKRGKGRRGLDLLHEIQIENPERVFVDDTDYPELEGVDAKLVKLAQQKQWIIVTNDFNLNKVAEIQGIDVLNINDLANAVKQMVVPGENINVFLLREGKEAGQAIAYFEDGTMIVVDNGRRFIGSSVMAEVTSVLQTSAGRMVFAKVANR